MTVTHQGRPHKYVPPCLMVPLPSNLLIHVTRLQTGTFTTRQNSVAIPAGRSLIAPHWQLRDLVQCTPYRPQSVFYVNNQVLREVDLTTGKITRATTSWEFAPRCIAVLDDLVVGGNDNGWIQAQSLNKTKDESMKSQLSTQINNNIFLYTALDGTRRALVGYSPYKLNISNIRNNDHSVKIWNIDKWRSDGTIKLPVAINHCSVSPDKTSMICAGDSSDVFLFDISTTGSFHHQATFKASEDSSFSTAFSCTSSVFAVASQDGIVSVWDRRFARTATPATNSGKLKMLKTTRPGSPYGAARLVRFSQGPLDLLMFTEQKEYVHLVDARTFEKTQILSVGEPGDSTREVDIGGASFAPDGKSIIVGSERAIWQWVISLV
jgi:WD40 repeat protein